MIKIVIGSCIHNQDTGNRLISLYSTLYSQTQTQAIKVLKVMATIYIKFKLFTVDAPSEPLWKTSVVCPVVPHAALDGPWKSRLHFKQESTPVGCVPPACRPYPIVLHVPCIPGKRVSTHPPSLWTDRHLWKYYLSATSFASGNETANVMATGLSSQMTPWRGITWNFF